MRCLKCGANVEHSQVFCTPCIEKMNTCPVSRETPVVILPRPKLEPARPRTVKPEELLLAARRRQRALGFLCTVMLVGLLLLGALLVYLLQRDDKPTGQTYTPNVTASGEVSSGGSGQ